MTPDLVIISSLYIDWAPKKSVLIHAKEGMIHHQAWQQLATLKTSNAQWVQSVWGVGGWLELEEMEDDCF